MGRMRVFIHSTSAGVAVAALVLIPSAGSANGDPLILGAQNSAALLTQLSGGLAVDNSSGASGVSGSSDSTGGGAAGVAGFLSASAPGPDSGAVRGVSFGMTSNGPGVFGMHYEGSGRAPGVLGATYSLTAGAAGVSGVVLPIPPALSTTAANTAGVYGTINSAAANTAGVRGDNGNTNCCGMGVAGFHAGQGIGVYGEAQNGFAVSGFSPNNWSGYFQGSVNVVGTLYKSSGAFRIDNPIDPAHSYLQHSFVESPDMKNVYDGVVTTNGKGFGAVKLPAWFQALNRDFRYQLTVVGKAHWDAKAAVWDEIAHNRFTIRTDQANVKVSWQVTGIRHDPYANAHRIETVVLKLGKAEGRYVHPQLYGKPLSKSVVVLPGMTRGTKPQFKVPTPPTRKWR